MKLREDLEKLINEAINNDMTQCVIKLIDKGNDLEFAGIIEEASNYASAYDMEADFAERLKIEDPDVQFVLAYHPGEVWDGTELYDEFEEPLSNYVDFDTYKKNDAEAKAAFDKLNQNGTVPSGEINEAEKEKIELETDFSNGVSVSSKASATDFVNLKFIELKDENTAKQQLKELIKICRANKIKVKGLPKVYQTLELYPEYKASVEEYNNTVAELQEDWKKIVEEGIYTGYGDDERINNAHKKRFKIEKILYGNTPFSKYNSLTRDIEEKLDDVKYQQEHPGDFGTITMIGF